jgi:hypothetical protein
MKAWPLLLLVPATLLAQDDLWDDEDWDDDGQSSAWTGFLEAGVGTRTGSDRLVDQDATLQELRLRAESEWQRGKVDIGFKADAAYDGVESGWDFELRDLTVAFTVGDNLDFKVGRQVQTWGTGDLLFLNDLFPKDFVSFFAGRDDEYLKAPGDAVRITRFSDTVNIDFVWTPLFEPDVYLTGERFSFFSPSAGSNVAPQPPLSAKEPDNSIDNGELAVRLFRTVEGREYALYAYRGFFKQPNALTPALEPTFAPLTTLGASLRRPLGPGLINVETAYYRSRDDRRGSDPLIPNDQLRLLAGYEWEAKPSFTVGLQYYLEWTRDYDRLIDNSALPEFEPDEYRHVLTNRLTYRAARDRHTYSLFTFFSPSDNDFYVRPAYTYRYSDQWTLTAGANAFGGDDRHTFFRQLQDASNVYVRIRYNY